MLTGIVATLLKQEVISGNISFQLYLALVGGSLPKLSSDLITVITGKPIFFETEFPEQQAFNSVSLLIFN